MKAETTITLNSLFGDCDEYMVIRFNANCLEKSGQRAKNSVAKIRAVLACAKPIINYRKLGKEWDVRR